jgi:hypothetical protein
MRHTRFESLYLVKQEYVYGHPSLHLNSETLMDFSFIILFVGSFVKFCLVHGYTVDKKEFCVISPSTCCYPQT